MNTSYRHLNVSEREYIMIMLTKGLKQAEIAKRLGRSPSTISRELKRLSSPQYSAQAATENYYKRRKRCKRPKKLEQPEYRQLIQDKLFQQQWSPEQISQRLKLENADLSISYNTIYRGINAGLFDVGERKARRRLRHRGKTRHTVNHEEKRGKIRISHPIEARPIEAAQRSELGHWEADTMIGQRGKPCLLTLSDRMSRLTLAQKVASAKADEVAQAMIKQLSAHVVRSITPDQGKEFARHEQVSEALGVAFFFPKPAQPWQRGTNENTNGLLREFFPKRKDISQWSDDYIQSVVDKLNLRPRKCLGWKTPYEIYFKILLHLV